MYLIRLAFWLERGSVVLLKIKVYFQKSRTLLRIKQLRPTLLHFFGQVPLSIPVNQE